MRKPIYLLPVLMLFIALCVNAQKEMTIPMIDVALDPVELDGIKEPAYDLSPVGLLENWNINTDQNGVENDLGEPVPGHEGQFWMLYDYDYVYLFCEMKDDDFCDDDELDFGFDLGGERAEYGWEGEPKDGDPFAFIVYRYGEYLSADTEIANRRGAEIVWVDNSPDWSYEARIKWTDITTDETIIDEMFVNGFFFFDIGSKNKYTDNEPNPDNGEFFQWSGNMNMFWSNSLLMGTVYLGEFDSKTSVTDHFSRTNLSIFPNPAKDFIRLTGTKINDIVTITNLSGKMVLRKTVDQSDGYLDISNIGSGMYILQVNGNSRKLFIQ